MKYEFETKFNIGDVVQPSDSLRDDFYGVVMNMSYNVWFNFVEVFVMYPNESKWKSEESLKLKK